MGCFSLFINDLIVFFYTFAAFAAALIGVRATDALRTALFCPYQVQNYTDDDGDKYYCDNNVFHS